MFNKQIKELEHRMLDLINNIIKNADLQSKANTKYIDSTNQRMLDLEKSFDYKTGEEWKNILESRLIEFKKEIQDKYYVAMADIFNFNRVMLLESSDKQLSDLKAKMLEPYIKQKLEKEKEEMGQRVLNRGVEIVDKRNEFHEALIKDEKAGKDISILKAQLEVFDWIIGVINEKS